MVIFTSYPKYLYIHLEGAKLIDKVFGAESILDDEGRIIDLKEIILENFEAVREKMNELGFDAAFTLLPDRYGLLELLLDEIIKNKINREDLIILGKGATVLPMLKVSARQVESLEELHKF